MLRLNMLLAYRAARAATTTVKNADIVETVVTGGVAVTYSYNQSLSLDQTAEAQRLILAGIESIAKQNAAEYEHQQKQHPDQPEIKPQSVNWLQKIINLFK